jgi:hypothetical protein
MEGGPTPLPPTLNHEWWGGLCKGGGGDVPKWVGRVRRPIPPPTPTPPSVQGVG